MTDESDADDFIVDDYGVSIAEKMRKKSVFSCRLWLQWIWCLWRGRASEYEDESADKDEYEEEEIFTSRSCK